MALVESLAVFGEEDVGQLQLLIEARVDEPALLIVRTEAGGRGAYSPLPGSGFLQPGALVTLQAVKSASRRSPCMDSEKFW